MSTLVNEEGRGYVKCQHPSARGREGVKNTQNPVNVVYEQPQRVENLHGKRFPFLIQKTPVVTNISYSDPKCDDCKGFIKNWSTAVQHDKVLIANATDYFNGTDFCAAKTPPGGLGMAGWD